MVSWLAREPVWRKALKTSAGLKNWS